MKCQAKTRDGRPCERHAMANGRCYLHGGKTPIGPANANYKHGKYSKFLPEGLRERYEHALSDPELIGLRSEVALLDARLGELLAQVEDGDTAESWREIGRLWPRYRAALHAGDGREQTRLLGLLGNAIEAGAASAVAWAEIQRLLEQRRKLVDTEQRRMQSMQQMITVEQAMALAAALVHALKEVVYKYADPVTAQHIVGAASLVYKRLIGTSESR